MIVGSDVARELGALLAALPHSDYRSASATWADSGRVVTMTVTTTITAQDETDPETSP